MSLEIKPVKDTSSKMVEGEKNITDSGLAKRNVVLTGFGLFRDHQSNPSWEIMKEGQLNIERPDVNIITKQFNVSYEEVDNLVDEIWKQYNPLVMIHCGLAAQENSIRLEQIARHGPFIHDDVLNYAPHKDLRDYSEAQHVDEDNTLDYTCKPCYFEFSSTCLNVERICEKLNQLHREGQVPISYKKSIDAGLYVCEYIFQRSLKICDRTIFIHVPNTTNYTLEEIRIAVKFAVEAVIDEALTLASN